MAIANEISGIEDCVYSLTNKANIMKLSINDIVIQLFIPLHGQSFQILSTLYWICYFTVLRFLLQYD